MTFASILDKYNISMMSTALAFNLHCKYLPGRKSCLFAGALVRKKKFLYEISAVDNVE
jgi:hypothetical protein